MTPPPMDRIDHIDGVTDAVRRIAAQEQIAQNTGEQKI